MAGALPKPRPREGLGGGVTGGDDFGFIIKQAIQQTKADYHLEKIISNGRDKVDKSVLSYFSTTRETSLQDILKQTSISYATLYTRLKGLTRDGLLLRRRAGWRHLFRLNPAHPVVQKHLELQEVARSSAYLASHPKQKEILALLEEAARLSPLHTAFLLNGHSGENGGTPGTQPPPSSPGSPQGRDGPQRELRPGPAVLSEAGEAIPLPATTAPVSGTTGPAAAELVFVVPEDEQVRKLQRLAPRAGEAAIRLRVQTPVEFRALVPYLNGSVVLAGVDFYLREKLRIVYSSGDFAIQAGNGLLSVFVRHPQREFTIQGVMAEAKRSYKPTYFGLKKLEAWGLLDHRREKWKHYYKLNLANPVVRKHLELEELRKGRASLARLPSPERLAAGELVTKAVRAIPLLAVLHRNSREGPTLYFVVQRRNGHGQTLQPLWAAAHLPSLKPRLIEAKDLKSLLGRGRNEFSVLYGEEFYLSLKLRALANGNGNGHAKVVVPEPAAVASNGSGT